MPRVGGPAASRRLPGGANPLTSARGGNVESRSLAVDRSTVWISVEKGAQGIDPRPFSRRRLLRSHAKLSDGPFRHHHSLTGLHHDDCALDQAVDETWNLESDDSFGELEPDTPATRDHSAFLLLASALSALYAKEKEGKDLLGDLLLAIPK